MLRLNFFAIIICFLLCWGFASPIFKSYAQQEANPCNNLSQENCFNKLSNCVKAASFSDYLAKRGFKLQIDGWPEKLTNEVTPPIPTNFPDAKIFLNRQPGGGGDFGVFPFINLADTYCELTDENLKTVFSPIKTKEDALKFYLFVNKELSSALGQSKVYILSEKDYENSRIDDFAKNCPDFKEKLNSRVTTIEDAEDGYIIDFILFNPVFKADFLGKKVKVKFDATIEEISRENLLDCGEGARF